jgi:hypothetical protein
MRIFLGAVGLEVELEVGDCKPFRGRGCKARATGSARPATLSA